MLASCGVGGTNNPNPTYAVTYDGNGNTGGNVPIDSANYVPGQTVTVLANTGSLVKTGYSFSGWNTQTDGSGTTYTQAQIFAIGAANVILYAKWTANPTYTVTYNGNNSTGGSAPIDSTNYQQGQTVTVLANTGNLVRINYSFSGWNTQADGSGTTYTQPQTFVIGASNVTLYAMWIASPAYTVIYDGNGNTGGNAPINVTNYAQGQTVTVFSNVGNLVKTGYVFSGWNTQADGSGTTYTAAQTFSMGSANVTLYAKWLAVFGYAYVANATSDSVSQYLIDVNGVLTPMSPATVAAAHAPNAITVDPSGKYVYVANESSMSISQYVIGANGSLASMATVTVAAELYPSSIKIDPLGKYAYVANQFSNSLSQYTINVNGALTSMTPATVATGTNPYSIAVDVSGKFVYVTNLGSDAISQFAIGVDGLLTSLTTATVATGKNPCSIALDPTGKFAYVINGADNTISEYTIDVNGSLIPLSPPMVAIPANPEFITVDASGKYVYVTHIYPNSGIISQYMIGAGGQLTPLSPTTVGTGNVPKSITVDPSGKFAYVTNLGNNNVSQYTIGVDGTLTPMNPATVWAGFYPVSITTVIVH